jgi:hypothetical protein
MTAAEARACRSGDQFSPADGRRLQRYAETDGARTQYARIWQAIRVLRTFTTRDLIAVCELQSRGTLDYFLGALRGAGYLGVAQPRSGVAGSYRLIRDTGPLAPVAQKKRRIVFDANTRTEYAIAPIRKPGGVS